MSWTRNSGDPLVLWQSNDYTMPSIDTTNSYWLLNDNTISAASATAPSIAVWFEIPTLGCDTVRVVFATKILDPGPTVTGLVTDSAVRASAVGQSYVDSGTDYLSQPAVTRAAYSQTVAARAGDSVALSVQGGLNNESGGITNSLLMNNRIGGGALLIPDGTAIEAGDMTWSEHRIRARSAAVDGGPPGGLVLASHPSTMKLTGLRAVFYCLRITPVITIANYTAVHVAGRLLAFRENEI